MQHADRSHWHRSNSNRTVNDFPERLIALDATGFCSTIHNGLNRYTGETIAALADLDQLRILSGDRTLCQQFGDRSDWINLQHIHQNNLRGNLSRLLWHQLALPRLLHERRSSVKASSDSRSGQGSGLKPGFFHSLHPQSPAPLFYSPVPEGMLRPWCPQIITVHDLLPLKFPEVYPRVKYYFRWILPRLLRASQMIVVSSENTRRDLQHYWPDLRTPSVVLPIPYRTDQFYPAAPECPSGSKLSITPMIAALTPYLLCVGETRPYKNIRRMIEAFARVIATGDRPTLTLAIVGTLNRLDTDIVDLPSQFGIVDRVQFLGRVSDGELAELYRGAAAFLFPSLYEGFGLPPLEAMACGCPTIVARASSLPEVCGTAAHYVDPLSVEDIAAGIVQVTGDRDYGDRLRHAGLEQVKQFQPEQFRQRLRAILGL